MEDRLADLSRGLSEAFAETIARIQKQPEGRARLGMNVLMWLTHARRTLKVSELSDILAMHNSRQTLHSKYRPHTKMILECCQGLVAVDAEGHVRVTHYAVQEYLDDHTDDLFPRGKPIITLSCLHYLLLDDFKDGPWDSDDDIELHLRTYPFLEYAAQCWGPHATDTESDSEVWSALGHFFSSTTALGTANQARQYTKDYNENYWAVEECRSFGPLHHASRHGLGRTITRLLDDGLCQVNQRTVMGATPIIHAAANRHVQTLKELLSHGADPYLENWYGNALHCAVESGMSRAIHELIQRGMDPNDDRTNGRGYLSCALARDHAEAFETLVQLGASINRRNAHDIPLFLRAAYQNCPNIVRLMVERRWVDIQMRSPSGMSAAHYAAHSPNPATMRELIQAGVDINGRDDEGRTPLDHAIIRDNSAVKMLLLDSGAKSGDDGMGEGSAL